MFATDGNKKIYDTDMLVYFVLSQKYERSLVQVNEVFVFLSYKGFESQLGVFCLSQLLTE